MINRIFRRAVLPGIALAVAAGTGIAAKAEVGVTDSTIVFGQAAALEGPASALGTGMRDGILAAFAEANRNGGIGGRQVELKSYDDGYEPERSIKHTMTLINQDHVFALIGAVGTPTSKATQLGPDGEGVVITQVVPLPWDSSIPLVQQYQAALKAHDAKAQPGFVSLEGYIVGRLAVAALGKVQGELTRDAFLKAFSGSFDLGGVTLTFGAGDNQGSDKVFLTVIQPDGSFKAVERLGSTS